ncbi:hypothetical protein E1293_22810 [Actinomadura darangshiensis]|uniref:Sulfotransferase family protein n=1 Tax=Actinomadura darangshiensis TaxID=705336 RepID=A0A4R5B380_9ACTN|nr:hypothetical protein [Actinomadura darangshiensis]TDD79645.1 hypothetical protein E1293_22810 [Actinomadura darangshiensis]
MASKIVLHIGLQKSGTTFLQHVLQESCEVLAEAGVRYPVLPDWDRGKRTVANHEWPSYGLLGTEYPWVSQRRAAAEKDSWQALLDEVKSWPGTVLLSAEALSVVRTAAVQRLLDALRSDDVEVVITARSLGRSLPSLWQQHIRNGRSTSFASYLGTLADQRAKGWEQIENDTDLHLWRAFCLNRLARRWSEAGATRVSVVTTPGRPPELLWRRFAQAAGLPDLAVLPGRQAHTGLTAAETLVLSSMNASIREGSWTGQNADWVRQVVTDRFQTRETRGRKVVIPLEWRDRLAEWSDEDLTALQDTSAHVIGDIDDLRYAPDLEQDSPPTTEEVGAAGAEATLALAELALQESFVQRNTRRVRRLLP